MNTKTQLIKNISSIKDNELLEDIDRLVFSLVDASTVESYKKDEIDSVREGYHQYKSGETLSQGEAKKIFNSWLQEK